MKHLVSDSGPLIALARIGRLDLFQHIVDQVLVPEAVARECTRDLSLPGALTMSNAFEGSPFSIHQPASSKHLRFPEGLGDGERAAIALALAKGSVLLIDDLGARAFALQLELKIVGLPGLLIIAKQQRVIAWVRPLLEALAGQNYFLSPVLRAEVLRRAGE